MMRMMMNDDHCYCRYWWSFVFTCDWPAASESVLEAGSVPDVSPQHVWATKSQRGAWEDEGRLERPGWEAETPDGPHHSRQTGHHSQNNSFTTMNSNHQRQIKHSQCFNAKACLHTSQISVFPRDLGQSSQRVQQGEDVDAAMARGLSSFDRNICTEVSMRSVLPNKKSAGILFCVTLTAAGVGGAAWPSQQYTHVTVDLVNTDP